MLLPAWAMETVLGMMMEVVVRPGLSVRLEKGRKRTNLLLDCSLLRLVGIVGLRLCLSFGGLGGWHGGAGERR